jgi:hypothetical protein
MASVRLLVVEVPLLPLPARSRRHRWCKQPLEAAAREADDGMRRAGSSGRGEGMSVLNLNAAPANALSVPVNTCPDSNSAP